VFEDKDKARDMGPEMRTRTFKNSKAKDENKDIRTWNRGQGQ